MDEAEHTIQASDAATTKPEGNRCIKLVIAYDGTRYQGWQRQLNGPTIQEAVEDAVAEITGTRSAVIGSGRTDSGVHAWGQVASFRTHSPLSADVLRKAFNAVLPEDIVVQRAVEAKWSFHPINDAISKRYRYVLQPGRINDPFSLRFAWFVKRDLDLVSMRSAASLMVGRHDFAAFQATGSPRQSTVRTMLHADVQTSGEAGREKVFIEVEADGFLYNMVRIIAGTLVEIGQGKRDAESIQTALLSGDRTQAGMTAPPHGLYLLHVHYPPDHELA